MERKAFAAEIKAVNEDKGEVQAYIAAFGNVDHQNDRIERGAFTKWLERGKSIPMLSQHDAYAPANTVVIGKWTNGSPDDHGLLMTGRVSLKTQAGREHFELMKDGMLNQFSIGYTVPDGGVDYETIQGKSVRVLKQIDLHEASVVVFPANESATLVGVKADLTDEERQRLADEGAAMPDGSYPIRNRDDLHNAIQAFGRAKDPEAVRAHIVKRARALGAEDMLPDGWKSADEELEYALALLEQTYIKSELEEFETKAGARNSAADMERIQAVHDMTAALGAQCAPEPDADDAKSADRHIPMSAKQAAELVARIVVSRI